MATGCDVWGAKRMSIAIMLRDRVLPAGLDWFIENGTLLGAHRNGKFIPHDDDFDIGIVITDIAAIEEAYSVIKERLPAPYEVRRISSYADKLEVYDPTYGLYTLEGYAGADFHYVTVDLQFHLRSDTGMCECLYRRGRPWRFDIGQVLPTTTMELEGETFPCPADTAGLLTMRYGCISEGAVFDEASGKYMMTPENTG